ncbi:MAG: MobV family relaxase [Sulfitobacter sp.]
MLRNAKANCLVSTHTHFFFLEQIMPAEPRKLLEEGWSDIKGSSFGIMRTAKIKTMGNMGASLQHTFRERETPNADPDRLKANTILIGADNSKDVLAAWKKRAPEKIRSNAVHGLEYLVTGSPEKMEAMTRGQQDTYFKDALGWIEERHGKENVLSAMIHRDETTPHLTVMTIPLDERGKLNCRSFVGNKKALSDLQSDFAEKVSEKHGLQRGIKRSNAHHERVKRVYGAYMAGENPVALPERVKGSLLRGGKESDEGWHARATEAATDTLRGFQMKMRDEKLGMEAKLNTAQSMNWSLRELMQNYRSQLNDARGTLARLVSSLEMADKGKETNAALEAYQRLEARVVNGDLGVLKDAAGSPHQIDKIAEMYDRVLPQGAYLTEDQSRFERALDSMIDTMGDGKKRKDPVRIALETRTLPHVQNVLAHVAKDRINPPFNSREECMAFRAEIEGCLSEGELAALKQGDENVLADILGDHLPEQEQMLLALAYYNHAEIEVDSDVRIGLIERLADLEHGQKHTDRDRGPIH